MIWLYRALWLILGPLIDVYFAYRLFKGKEEFARFGERLGRASLPRPQGKLLWIHAASVGESLSVLPLIKTLLEKNKSLNILITSGTVTSAKLLAKRLPARRAFHQYVPLDFGLSVHNFISYWKPDASLFVECELWPELLRQAPNPMLINARITEKSFKAYKKYNGLFPVKRFMKVWAQSEMDAERTRQLGAADVEMAGNLKYDAEPLSVDSLELNNMLKLTKDKIVLVAASTQKGEDAIIISWHKKLSKLIPNLLTIIAPRHPHRAPEIAGLCIAESIPVKCREDGTKIKENFRNMPDFGNEQNGVYIANTIGEMGLWFKLADTVLIGRSLKPFGGSNPLEPLAFSKPTICGPHMENFTDTMATLEAKNILKQAKTLDETYDLVQKSLLSDNTQKLKLSNKFKTLTGPTKICAEYILLQINAK